MRVPVTQRLGATFLSGGGGHLFAGADSVSADRLASFRHYKAGRNERSTKGGCCCGGRLTGTASAVRVASVAVYK